MNDRHRYMDYHICNSHQDVELDFADFRYDGPRGETITLSPEDAYSLATDLASLFGLKLVSENAITFSPCDGNCDWCGDDCSNKPKKRKRHLRLVEDSPKKKDNPYAHPPAGMFTPADEWYKHVKHREDEGNRDF
jgi:hypothetical protein